LIGKAFPALSRFPEAQIDHGDALRLAGKREEALESYRRGRRASEPRFRFLWMVRGI
jgi:hypothetical protein